MSRSHIKIWIAILVCCPLLSSAFAQTTSGNITDNQTWSGTITLTGDVIVRDGALLTIAPGTVVKFAGTNDNPVYGNAAHIRLVALETGSISAIGTENDSIRFTSALASPARGSWGMISLKNLQHDSLNVFRYCVIEYAETGIDMVNRGGLYDLSATSAPVIDRCNFRHILNQAVFCASNGAPTVSNCRFSYLGGCCLASYSGSNIDISYCHMHNVASGILCAGENAHTRINIDHVTMHDIHLRYVYPAKAEPWNGFAVFCTNSLQEVNLTNSIVSEYQIYGFLRYGWSGIQDYNCWYGGKREPFKDSTETPGANSILTDPMLVNADSADFRLYDDSPCLNSASDGTHMGAWQGSPVSVTDRMAFDRLPDSPVLITPNPFTDRVAFSFRSGSGRFNEAAMTVFTGNGRAVRKLTNDTYIDRIIWDGTDGSGLRVDRGIYFYILVTGDSRHRGRLVMAE